MRQPNELWVAPVILEQIWAEGYPKGLHILSGPHPEAKIIDVRFEDDWVKFTYDREVPEVMAQRTWS